VELKDYLMTMVNCDASDLYLSPGIWPSMRVEGQIQPAADKLLDADQVRKLAYSVMNGTQRRTFEQELEITLGFGIEGAGRFRANIYHHRGLVGMVIRYLKSKIPVLASLGLPDILGELIMQRQGLILVVGATGSGKSTTLASMLHHRNMRMAGHMVLIEDPIEYFHLHKCSIMTQRELGTDTHSYHKALASAMHEAPDVVMIGEIRDTETMEYAMHFAETGHLCLATLHAGTCCQAVERIINFFPRAVQTRVLQNLALELRAVIAQRLVPSKTGKRVAAVEHMINTPAIADLIRRGDIGVLKEHFYKPVATGAESFDNALLTLLQHGTIDEQTAIDYAESQHDMQILIADLDQSVKDDE